MRQILSAHSQRAAVKEADPADRRVDGLITTTVVINDDAKKPAAKPDFGHFSGIIIARRMTKKQQMRWNRWTVQPFLDVRVAVLDGTLEGSFRKMYPGFRSANDHKPASAAA
jgi:hypothetical protein